MRNNEKISAFSLQYSIEKKGESVISIDDSYKNAYTGMEPLLLSLVEGIGHRGTGRFSF